MGQCGLCSEGLGLAASLLLVHFTLLLLYIREFPSEEIAYYCNALKLETIVYPVLGSLVSCVGSAGSGCDDHVTVT